MVFKLRRAVAALDAGGVVAYPTEAIWGFGCEPHNPAAVAKLLRLKSRPVEKGLILVGASSEQFQPYLQGLEQRLIDKFCAPVDRPTTWLVPANKHVPVWIKGNFDSVALRVSAYKPVQDLCLMYGGPIVSTSANRSGYPPAVWPWSLRKFLGYGLDYVLPGSTGSASSPSEIKDLISDKVIRSA